MIITSLIREYVTTDETLKVCSFWVRYNACNDPGCTYKLCPHGDLTGARFSEPSKQDGQICLERVVVDCDYYRELLKHVSKCGLFEK